MYAGLPLAWIVTVTFSAPAFSTFTTGAATPIIATDTRQQLSITFFLTTNSPFF